MKVNITARNTGIKDSFRARAEKKLAKFDKFFGGNAQAQVTAGGLEGAQFDPDTLEARRVPGLYAAGEMLDVDGPCGGYNLQWAWASALLAARSMDERLKA